MSCDSQRRKLFGAFAGRPGVAAALGGGDVEAASRVLEDVYDLVAAQEQGAHRSGAEDRALALRARGEAARLQVEIPSHGRAPVLHGHQAAAYLAVFDTLRAVEVGKAVPELVQTLKQRRRSALNVLAVRLVSRPPRHMTTQDCTILRRVCTTPTVTLDQVRQALDEGVRPDSIAKLVLSNADYTAYWEEVRALLRTRDAQTGAASQQFPTPQQRADYDRARLAYLAEFETAHRDLVFRWCASLVQPDERPRP